MNKSSHDMSDGGVIRIASPEVIRSWSRGEIKTSAAFKPGKDGHVELAVPVSHIWFFKSIPSRIGLMLEKKPRELERIIYCEAWGVTDPGDTPLKLGEILDKDEFKSARSEFDDEFRAETGAFAVRTLLEQIDLQALHAQIKHDFALMRSKAVQKRLSRRLQLVESFIQSSSRPEWMILEVLPVIPFGPVDGFDVSELNDLYLRVIECNCSLKNVLRTKKPEKTVLKEKRLLQEAVDALLQNLQKRIYACEAEVFGRGLPRFDCPESFNVLLRGFRSLGLDVQTVKRSENPSK